MPAAADARRAIARRWCPPEAPDFVQRVTAAMMAGKGDLLPVSALPVDGTFPTDTAQWEQRSIAREIPIWDPAICIDCAKCALVCPHSAIRMKVFEPEAVATARPTTFQHKEWKDREHPGRLDDDPGRARRLHRLRRLRRRVPGARQVRGQAQVRSTCSPKEEHLERRARELGLLPVDRRPGPARRAGRHRQGLAAAAAAVRVLGRLRRAAARPRT